MQGVDEERKKLLTILLVVTLKLLTALGNIVLEMTWNHDFVPLVVHALDKTSKLVHKFTMESVLTCEVHLLRMQLPCNKVLMEDLQIGQNLECRVHVACVAKVVQAHRPTSTFLGLTRFSFCFTWDLLLGDVSRPLILVC